MCDVLGRSYEAKRAVVENPIEMNGAFELRLQRHRLAELHQIFVVSSGPHQKQLTQIWCQSDLWFWRYKMNVK